MLRHSLYKKFGKKSFQIGGAQDLNPMPTVVKTPQSNQLMRQMPEGFQTFEVDPNTVPSQDQLLTQPSQLTGGMQEANLNQPSSFAYEQQNYDPSQGLNIVDKPTEPAKEPSFLDKALDYTKNNWQDMATTGLLGVRGILNYKDDIKKDRKLQQQIQRRGVDATPLYDYNWMYGRTTSGGTEYQPTIMAQDGAQLNTRTPMKSPQSTNVEIEGGEFLILPDGTTELAQGPSHSKGGIDTKLPEGTKVFSNHLRPMDLHKMKPDQKAMLVQKYAEEGGDLSMGMGLDYLDQYLSKEKKRKFGDNSEEDESVKYSKSDRTRTFAELAKRYDLKQFQEILDNPFASAVDKNTAEILMRRNQQILDQLFRDQQILNGNSTGEPMPQKPMQQMQPQMRDGGINNPGFRALPQDVQQKILKNMEEGGTYMQKGGEYQIQKKNGKYYNPKSKKYYKIPNDAQVKRDNDPNLQPGDYVVSADGNIKKFTSKGYERVSTTKSSKATDIKSGREELSSWAKADPANQAKVDRANAIIQKGINEGTISKPDKEGNITITGKFNANLEDRLLLSEVVNKTGAGFGTDKFKISKQQGTQGFSGRKQDGSGLTGGSFVAGFTPELYEQRISYERAKADGKSHEEALKIANTEDPKQKAENRKFFMKEIGMDPSNMSEQDLLKPDFYKDNYSQVTQGMETAFGQSEYRPSMGNDLLSGFEHFDAASYKAKNEFGDIELEPDEEPDTKPEGNEYSITTTQRGEYNKQPYPSELDIPSMYAMGQETFPYAIPEVAAPYVRPQTLNIQSQLQDADNNAIAAMRYGADPNMAYIAGLDAKQKAFQTKQNYDAEGRWKADLYNADAKFKADVYNADVFNQVYNDMYAGAKSAQGENRVAAMTNLVQNRAKWNQDENTKKFDLENTTPSLSTDKDGNVIMNPNANPNMSWSSSSTTTTRTSPSSVTTSTVPPAQSSQATSASPTQATQETPSTTPTTPSSVTPAMPTSGSPLNMEATRADQMWMKMGGEMENYLNPFKKKKVRGFRKKK